MASKHRSAIGLFPNRPKTAAALQSLRDSGFSMGNVTVVAKEAGEQKPISGVKVEEEVGSKAETGGAIGMASGGVLGGVTGLLAGLGTLVIPGIGTVAVAGEAAALFSTLLGGAAGSVAGGLVGALIGRGIPEHRAKHYSDRVAAGDYLILLKGSQPEIANAEQTMREAQILEWGVYPLPETTSEEKATPSETNN